MIQGKQPSINLVEKNHRTAQNKFKEERIALALKWISIT